MASKEIVLINEQLLIDNSSSTYDLLRRELGGVWTNTSVGNISQQKIHFNKIVNNNIKIQTISNPIPVSTEEEPNIQIRNNESKIRELEKDELLNLFQDIPGWQPYRQTVELVQINNTTTTNTDSLWQTYISNLFTIGRKEDFITSLDYITTKDDLLNLGRDATSAPGGVEYVYNYNDIEYERLLQRVRDYNVIPEIYTTIEFQTNTEVNTNVESPTLRSLRQNIRLASLQRNMRAMYENKIVPIENTNFLLRNEGAKGFFPMYCEIKIPLDMNNDFAQMVKKTATSCILLRDLQGVVSTPANSVGTEKFYYSVPSISEDGEITQNNFNIDTKTMDVFKWTYLQDIANIWPAQYSGWWANDAPGWVGSNSLPDNFMYIGDEQKSSNLAELRSPTNLTIALNNFFVNLSNIISEKRRTFRDLLNGKKAYSETLLYKVTKYKGKNLDNPVQTFHFYADPNDKENKSEQKILSFIDSQVKYGEKYTYAVTAYQIVIGSEYQYENLNVFGANGDAVIPSEPYSPGGPSATPDTSIDIPEREGQLAKTSSSMPRRATFDVTIAPSVKLIEVPLFISFGKIIDHPPMSPQIEFIPIKGRTNILKMHFQTGIGKADLEPIAFNDIEQEDYEQIAYNQMRTDGTITFSADDSSSSFVIYRTDKQPIDYSDFYNNLFLTIQTNFRKNEQNFDVSSISRNIRQQTNKKYYYVFRSIDTHGHYSYPSPVYEIELYDDGGAGYPIIREYQFQTINPKSTTKSARKLIQIVPRFTQAYLNEIASNLIDSNGNVLKASGNKDITLGLEDDPLFGKKFKIRLTSKQTGKKIDINVDFKTKRVRSEIE